MEVYVPISFDGELFAADLERDRSADKTKEEKQIRFIHCTTWAVGLRVSCLLQHLLLVFFNFEMSLEPRLLLSAYNYIFIANKISVL